MGTAEVAWFFALAAISANACYTLVYALEFLLGGEEPVRLWRRGGRLVVLVLGTLLGAFIAFRGGIAIATIEYQYR